MRQLGDGAVGRHSALRYEEAQHAWLFHSVLTCWMKMSTECRVSHINCPSPQIHWTRNHTAVLHKMAKTIFKTVMVLLATMPYTKVSEQNTTSISTLPKVKLRESRYLRNAGPLSTRGNILEDKKSFTDIRTSLNGIDCQTTGSCGLRQAALPPRSC
jgi:hypothetical protein